MRICFINSFYAPDIGGGAELTLQRIAATAAAMGHDVSVICTAKERHVVRETVDGCDVRRVPLHNIYSTLSRDLPPKPVRLLRHWIDRDNKVMGRRVAEQLADIRPEVVSCHNLSGLSAATWGAVAGLGIPQVQVLHDLYLLCPPTTMTRGGQACVTQCAECRLFRRNHPAMSGAVDAAVGVSRFIIDRFESYGYFPNASLHVIHNGQAIPDPGRREHDPAAPLTFGFIGSLTPVKGIEWLIEQLPADGSARLRVAGAGSADYMAHLRAKAAGKPLEFLGHMKNADFYPTVDVSVVPSIWPDTFPGVAYEASAHHLPVIASNRGGLPEIIRPGVNGLLCDPGDPPSLGQAMQALIADRAEVARLSAAARESVAPFLDKQRMVDAYLALYAEVIERKQAMRRAG